jgi:transposase InsO family protein
MREHDIAGFRLRRRVRTTIPDPSGQKVPDLLKRNFSACAPNQVYVGDITYLPIADGSNLYLATVIDCCSRRLAGWAITDHMRTSLIEAALNETHSLRRDLDGVIFHSDHGAQGGFNRSSQHLGRSGRLRSCDGSRKAFPSEGTAAAPSAVASRSGSAGSDAFARSSAGVVP